VHSVSTLAALSGKRNVTVWRLSVRQSVGPIFFLTLIERAAILNVTRQGAARDAVSVHFRLSIPMSDILVVVALENLPVFYICKLHCINCIVVEHRYSGAIASYHDDDD